MTHHKRVNLPRQGEPGLSYSFHDDMGNVLSIYVENFGEDGVNIDVYTSGDAASTDVRMFKDGRQPFTCHIPAPNTVSVQVSRAREGETE